jgi:UDPglucose 6-dehydrogenase
MSAHGQADVCVAGLWHLGTVTAACLASSGCRVLAYDEDPRTVTALEEGRLPVHEPGLADLIRAQRDLGRLTFTHDVAAAAAPQILWITWDTPVDDEDRSDAETVLARIERFFPHLASGSLVIVSSQLPVGSVAELERRAGRTRAPGDLSFACIPENLRLGNAIERFTRPDRVVAGVRGDRDRAIIARLLAPYTTNIEWMRVESAEMTKHAINAYLAASIAFMNEMALICERVGADAAEVSRGLKSDARIGPRAYLSPGAAFAGGTLARDLMTLSSTAASLGESLPLVTSVLASNQTHRSWAFRRLHTELGDVRGRTVAIWGLTYKPGTDTLRRSGAVELCELLNDAGARVRAYDPVVRVLPEDLAGKVALAGSAREAALHADAIVVATEWPEFLEMTADAILAGGASPIVLDPGRFLAASFGHDPRIRYISVGRQV